MGVPVLVVSFLLMHGCGGLTGVPTGVLQEVKILPNSRVILTVGNDAAIPTLLGDACRLRETPVVMVNGEPAELRAEGKHQSGGILVEGGAHAPGCRPYHYTMKHVEGAESFDVEVSRPSGLEPWVIRVWAPWNALELPEGEAALPEDLTLSFPGDRDQILDLDVSFSNRFYSGEALPVRTRWRGGRLHALLPEEVRDLSEEGKTWLILGYRVPTRVLVCPPSLKCTIHDGRRQSMQFAPSPTSRARSR